MARAKPRTARDKALGCGMVIAAGIIMSSYGDDTLAAEILHAAGATTVKDMRAMGVDTYDIRLLVPVLKHLREQARTKEERAKARRRVAGS